MRVRRGARRARVPRALPAAEAQPFDRRPGTLEHFLTERYCLYTADGGRLYRAELHHPPWRLQAARGDDRVGDDRAASPLDGRAARCCSRPSQDVLVWPLEEL